MTRGASWPEGSRYLLAMEAMELEMGCVGDAQQIDTNRFVDKCRWLATVAGFVGAENDSVICRDGIACIVLQEPLEPPAVDPGGRHQGGIFSDSHERGGETAMEVGENLVGPLRVGEAILVRRWKGFQRHRF